MFLVETFMQLPIGGWGNHGVLFGKWLGDLRSRDQLRERSRRLIEKLRWGRGTCECSLVGRSCCCGSGITCSHALSVLMQVWLRICPYVFLYIFIRQNNACTLAIKSLRNESLSEFGILSIEIRDFAPGLTALYL